MADENKNPDEYEYPSEEYYKGEEFTPPDDSVEPLDPGDTPKTSFISRRVFMILGLVVAVGIVYLVLMFTNAKRNSELASPTPTIDTASSSIPQAAPVNQDSQSQGVAQIAQVPTPAPDANALAQMAQQNQIAQQSMADLQNQVQQLQTQITDVTNSISTLNNQIQVLANELRAVATDKMLKGRGISLVTSGTSYILKALIPGRAWLQARDGTTTTVTVGDRLAGYGIIQMINPEQGIVTTSSGAIIQYGPRDN